MPAAEVRRRLRQARVLVLPSLWFELQGLVVAEAAALGVPSIVPDTSGARDWVTDGVDGFWFRGGDVADLTHQIDRVRRAPDVAARLGRAAYERFWAAPPTLERHIRDLERVYGAMLDPEGERVNSAARGRGLTGGIAAAGPMLALAGLVGVLVAVRAAAPLRVLYPLAAVGIGQWLERRDTPRYVSFVIWLWFLTPLVRRMADLHAGWQDPSLVLLTPYLVTALSVPPMLRGLLRPARRAALRVAGVGVFAVAGLGVVIGIPGWDVYRPLIGDRYVQLAPAAGVRWYLATRDVPVHQVEACVVFTFVAVALVAGTDGLDQFVALLLWDINWMQRSGMTTIGLAELFLDTGVRHDAPAGRACCGSRWRAVAGAARAGDAGGRCRCVAPLLVAGAVGAGVPPSRWSFATVTQCIRRRRRGCSPRRGRTDSSSRARCASRDQPNRDDGTARRRRKGCRPASSATNRHLEVRRRPPLGAGIGETDPKMEYDRPRQCRCCVAGPVGELFGTALDALAMAASPRSLVEPHHRAPPASRARRSPPRPGTGPLAMGRGSAVVTACSIASAGGRSPAWRSAIAKASAPTTARDAAVAGAGRAGAAAEWALMRACRSPRLAIRSTAAGATGVFADRRPPPSHGVELDPLVAGLAARTRRRATPSSFGSLSDGTGRAAERGARDRGAAAAVASTCRPSYSPSTPRRCRWADVVLSRSLPRAVAAQSRQEGRPPVVAAEAGIEPVASSSARSVDGVVVGVRHAGGPRLRRPGGVYRRGAGPPPPVHTTAAVRRPRGTGMAGRCHLDRPVRRRRWHCVRRLIDAMPVVAGADRDVDLDVAGRVIRRWCCE